ncbi:hypothetical protein [Longicatena caecimuris]|uniref:hypothetical protein n=1 Tax=Longicatena caecimuris TaxID=1796635 RepID=UPI00399AFC2E
MISVSQDFKDALKSSARQLDAYYVVDGQTYHPITFTVDRKVYSSDTETFIGSFIGASGSIKVQAIDAVNLEDKWFTLFGGIQVAGAMQYVQLGEFKVYEKSDAQEYNFADKRILFNVKAAVDEIAYPTTPLKLAQWCCSKVGVPLANASFPNCDLNIPKAISYGSAATYADIIQAIAQASCSFAVIDGAGKLSFRWFEDVENFTLDVENLSQSWPVTAESFGPINSVVLSREPLNDYIDITDKESIAANGLTELKIANNPILDIDRHTSKIAIFNLINGFTYVPVTVSTQGMMILEAGDIVPLQLKDGTYVDLYVLDHTLTYRGSMLSDFETPAMSKTQIDYQKSESVRQTIKNTEAIVDKQDQKISLITEKLNSTVDTLKNSISVSLSTNYVANQSYEQATKKYAPDYTLTPLKIMATVMDSLMQSSVAATITWTRKVQDSDKWTALTTGESVSGNTLTISHNLAKTTQYRAVASVKVGATQYTAEKTITINVNILEDTTIKGDVCKIEASSYCFTEMKEQVESEDEEGNITTETVSVYNPGNITLTPKFFNCNFDCWQYSADLGTNFTVIEPTDEPYQFEEDDPSAGDENIVRVKVNDAYLEGVHFNKKKRILTVYYDADCFDEARAVVFKLKSDVDGGSDTVTLTLDGDHETQYGNLSDALDALKESYTSIIQELDGLEGTITTRIEQSDAIYTDMFEDVQKQISEIIQTASDITETFTSVKEWVDENGSDLEQISAYIRRSSAGIEVGEVDAAVKTLMGTSYFAILLNDSIAMKLEKDLLTIKKVLAQSGLQLGKNIFTANSVGFRITWGG